jgi:hypothetical protein
MAFDWPATLEPQTFAAGLRKSGLQFRSPFNGSTQSIDFVAERWVFSMTLRPRRMRDGSPGVIEALANQLAGGVERVRCWHFARPVPLGTMRGAPTLSSTASRGNTSLAITGGTANGTLKAGDMLGAGSFELFQVAADITLNGSGAGTVSVINRVRNTISSGSAVTWDAPKAEFISPSMLGMASYRPAILEGMPFDLEQCW